MELFDGLGIDWVEREHKKMADLLANVALNPIDITFSHLSQMETLVRPSVPDNIENWQVFDDEKEILRFLTCTDEFSDLQINFNDFVETFDGKESLFGKEVIQLKTNKIPKGLVALENVFDHHDIAQSKINPSQFEEVEEVNLGTE